MTTEAAAMAVCLLGAMCVLGHPGLAAGLGIVTAAILAYKQPLHGLVGHINRDELYAGLRLLIASFVVLPLLPRRTIDPWEALNPYSLWLLVVLISTLSLVGYVATRWLGRRGAARRSPGHGRVRLVDGGHAQLRAPQPRDGVRRSGRGRARLWHPPLLGGDVRPRGRRGARRPSAPVAQIAPAFGAMGVAAAIAAWWHYRRRLRRGRGQAAIWPCAAPSALPRR